jgi:hypothetical protein
MKLKVMLSLTHFLSFLLCRSAELFVRQPTLLYHHTSSLDTPTSKHDVTFLKSFNNAERDKQQYRSRSVIQGYHDIERTSWTSRIPKQIGLFIQVSHYSVEVDMKHLDIVLDSLVELFRLNSLEVKYDDTPTLVARCRTCLEKLEFNIFVWQSRTSSNRFIVEVHRVFGDSIPFHSIYANLILETVRGAASANGNPYVASCAIHDPITRGTSEEDKIQLEAVTTLLDHFRQEYLEDENNSNNKESNTILSTMNVIHKMLVSQRYDLLGKALENLVQLTSAATSGLETAITVSNMVLLGHPNDDTIRCDSNHDTALKYIHRKVIYLAISGQCIDNNMFSQDQLTDHSLAALVVIGQAVNNVETSDLRLFVSSAQLLLPNASLIDMLLKRVEEANDGLLHAAYLASHILSVIASSQLSETKVTIQMRVDDIERAYQIGSRSHAALELACSRLLETINA